MNFICKILGHSMKSGWIGARGGPFGAISINTKCCRRCGETEYEYTTATKLPDFKRFESTGMKRISDTHFSHYCPDIDDNYGAQVVKEGERCPFCGVVAIESNESPRDATASVLTD